MRPPEPQLAPFALHHKTKILCITTNAKLSGLHCKADASFLQASSEVWDSDASKQFAQSIADLSNVIGAEDRPIVPLEQRREDFTDPQILKNYNKVSRLSTQACGKVRKVKTRG